jgi:hypothetical protein
MNGVLPPRFKVGDKVQIKSARREVGRVAEVAPADHAGSRPVYKVRIRTMPDGEYIDVGEDWLEKTCLAETGTSSAGEEDPVHHAPTRRSEYCYCFTGKHHGRGKRDDARWLPEPELSRVEEFTVFDTADFHNISDAGGRLYGVLKGADGNLRELGMWQQEIAEFPVANPGVPWHGYPIWAVNEFAPPNRARDNVKPSKAVFQQMVNAGLITRRDQKRLSKGHFS